MVIIISFVWTFVDINNLSVGQKGLLLRNPVWLLLSLLVPIVALRRRIPPSEYPFRTDALLISPLAIDMGANMVVGSYMVQYMYWSWADKIAHFWGLGVVTFFVFLLMAGKRRDNSQPNYKGMILISLILAGIWELYEHLSDRINSTVLVVGWHDSAGDVVAGLLGVLLCTYWCRRWYKMTPQPERERYLETIRRMFPPISNTGKKEYKVDSEL